jgi:phage shock protein PspC (stress-responsive transcriptional regulator)
MFFVVISGCKITKKMAEYKKLYRSKDKKICGVCGGLANYFELDPVLLRLLWVILTFASCSIGLIAYLVCALIIPQEP